MITTERLQIRALTVSDAKALFGYRQKALVAKFQSFHPECLEDAIGFIEKNTVEFGVCGTWYQLGIFFADDMLIGDVGVHFIDQKKAICEIGYTIDPTYQRRGYGKEAVAGVIDFLFNEFGSKKVVASIDPLNTASVGLLERLGFRKESECKGKLFPDGSIEDESIYGLSKESTWIVK